MKRAARFGLLISSCAAGVAGAQTLGITGTNTLRFERYDTSGSRAATPYPFSLNTGFDEFVFSLDWQPQPYDRWNGIVAGVVNDSPYRSPFDGVVPERLALVRENGAARLPYRLEIGDYFGFTSFRTLQRPLKGASFELQPQSALTDSRMSLQVFAGAVQPNWRNFQWNDDNTMGLSWLAERGGGRLLVNVLRNERNFAPLPALDQRREQYVASVAGDAPFALGQARLRAEFELAGMRGDHDGLGIAGAGRDTSDTGALLQLSGGFAGSTLAWRLRGERYGQDYRPFGAAIVPDRRSGEAHVAWTSASALNLRARLQHFRDFAETVNPLDTRVAGIGASGPLALIGASVNFDAFQQSIERRDGAIDQDSTTANLNLSRPFGPVVGQLNLLYQHVDYGRSLPPDQTTTQAGLALTFPLQLGVLRGFVTPGLIWRDVDGVAATRDVQPTLALGLNGGAHRLMLNAGRLAQNPVPAGTADIATVNIGLDYRYRWRQHEFGFDVTVFDRRPDLGEQTQAYRAGVFWIYRFQQVATQAGTPSSAAIPVPQHFGADAGLLAAIAPGAALDATLGRIAAAALGTGQAQPGAVVFDLALLADIDQRQRLVLLHDGGRIERAALVVSLAESGAPERAERTYDRVLRGLIDRFGRPSVTFEEGAFGPGFANDLASGRLIRIAEWTTSAGVLRLGLPRRLDGIARIEVHHARSFGSPRDTVWGVEQIR